MKTRMNTWKRISMIEIGLIIILLVTGFWNILQETKTTRHPELLCNEIKGTPAWVKEGVIFDYGYKGKQKGIVDALIKSNIYFLYSSYCGYCEKQIADFGEDWNKYVDSGLTIDCSKIER